MNIIAADDERIALQLLMSSICEAAPNAKVNGFSSGEDALAFAINNPCEIAFLDIDMNYMDGIELAKQLKIVNPNINVIFVTAYKKYAMEALSLHSSGYVLKPATKEKIEHELNDLRYPVEVVATSRVKVQAFGNFDVFVDNRSVKFQYSKTKELFAYLIDRNGSLCTIGEIVAVLWEDENISRKRSYLGNLTCDLINTFLKLGCGDVIVKERGKIGIRPKSVMCDYFDWNNNLAYAINAYRGEYMTQYSWAEITLSDIEQSRRI